MDLAVTSASVLGATDETHWNQSYSLGNLIVVFEVVGARAAFIGKDILTALNQKLESQKPSNLKTLENILKEVVGGHDTISVAACLLYDEILYVVVFGGAAVFVLRQTTLVPIVADIGTASGKVHQDDIFVLRSKGFSATITDLKLIVSEAKTAESLAEQLSTTLQSTPQKPAGAAAIVSLSQALVITPPLKKSRHLPQIFSSIPPFRLPRIKFRLTPLTIIISLLSLLLVSSIVFGLRTREGSKIASAYTEVMQISQHQFEEGMALIDLNPKRARELLKLAKSELEKISTAKLNEAQQKEISALLEKINQGTQTALRSYDIVLTPFFQLELIKSGAQADRMALYKDVLILVDPSNKALYRLSLSSKASKIIAGGETLGQAITPLVAGEEVYVVTKNISAVTSQGTLREVIAPDVEWAALTDAKAYGGNIYLLDATKNQIWKYIRTESGFSNRQNYLLPDTLIEFQPNAQLAIDGLVWVTSAGNVYRFTQGGADVWQIQGLDQDVSSDLDLYVDEDTHNLYLLDRINQRLVVTDKAGIYLAQYHWSQQIKVSDLVVSEVIKKALLLSGDTIYAIDLK